MFKKVPKLKKDWKTIHQLRRVYWQKDREALRDTLDSLPKEMFLTITRDNGSENALHHEAEIDSYFCDPYCSWQKGGVENVNGLIREFLPKGMNLDNVTDLEIQEIEDKLNNRPRKKNNYLTPNEVTTAELEKRGFHS